MFQNKSSIFAGRSGNASLVNMRISRTISGVISFFQSIFFLGCSWPKSLLDVFTTCESTGESRKWISITLNFWSFCFYLLKPWIILCVSKYSLSKVSHYHKRLFRSYTRYSPKQEVHFDYFILSILKHCYRSYSSVSKEL
jgi:hypothetical protein